MGIKDFIEKFKERNSHFKELQNNDIAAEKLRLRKMSSNERELEKYMEKERQEKIKKMLSNYHKKEKKEYFHKDIIKQKNIFKGGDNLLNQKKLFSDNQNLFTNKENMFGGKV